MHPIVLLLVAAAVIGGIAYLAHLNERKRRQALEAWAARAGFVRRDGKDEGLERRFPLFACLREGSDRYGKNLMEGDRGGRRVCAFDYHYVTHSTDSKGRRQTHHHNFSAVVVDTGLPLRGLLLRPEGFFDRFTEFFGFDDIDFEHAAFSRKFFVKAKDRRWAFDVLHQATIDHIMDSPVFTVEMAGPWVMARRTTRFAPEDFSASLALVEGILDRLPRYLLQDLKGVDA